MSLLATLVVLVLYAGGMLYAGHSMASVLTLGLATVLALAGAGIQALKQWRDGKSLDSLSARLAVLEGENKQFRADIESLRTQRVLERIGG